MGLSHYLTDSWNQLDTAIVLMSLVGIGLEETEGQIFIPIDPTVIRVIRVLRIARVLKLLKETYFYCK